MSDLVLVTGGTGYIASYCILSLLEAGYTVRTTIRSADRVAEVLAMLGQGGGEPGDRLSFFVADLTSDDGWARAAAGCRFVIHGASPTPSGRYAHESDWIVPAVQGVQRVLKASRDAGVRRVVLTSAFGAIGVGHRKPRLPYTEEIWSNLEGDIAPYQKSKTLSEKAAWDFIAQEGGSLELTVINPVAVLGPALGPDFSHSLGLIRSLLNGTPGCPKINSGYVDVRDLADLHLKAMTDPAAKGQRFLAISGSSWWMRDVAKVLRRHLGHAARKVTTWEIPNWMVRLLARSNPALRMTVPHLGVNMNASSEKAQRLLGWRPRPVEESIIATAESLFRLGIVKPE